MYAEGTGVPQDYAESYFWFDLAAMADVGKESRGIRVKARDEAASRLTLAALLDVQKRARMWSEERSRDMTEPSEERNGVYRVGGRISAPVQLNSIEAEFSEEARRAKYQGVCVVSLVVDARGNPQEPRVVRTLGMGLDAKALEAVRKLKFEPAMKDGKTPVPVTITVNVNFRLK